MHIRILVLESGFYFRITGRIGLCISGLSIDFSKKQSLILLLIFLPKNQRVKKKFTKMNT